MAINEVLFPTVPNPVTGDWAKAIELIEHAYKNINNPVKVSGSNVVIGAVFQVGGHVYHTDLATAITGTASDYVLLTVTGTTLVPSFVSDLTGVTWNSLWGGYYDGTGNLCIFDEVKAILAGDLVGGSSKFAELFNSATNQRLKTTDDVTFNTLDTGQGANELHGMDQNVKTTDDVTFNSLELSTKIIYARREINGDNLFIGTKTEDEIFDKISPFIQVSASPNFAYLPIHGSIGTVDITAAYINTITPTTIIFLGMTSAGANTTISAVDGDSSSHVVSLAW